MAILTFGGGLNTQDDINVLADECVDGENFRLNADQRSFRPRPAFDLKATATNGAEIRGIMQMITKGGTKTTLVQAGAQIYSVNSSFAFATETSTGVSASSRLRGAHWTLDEKLVITDLDKLTTVREWDGANVTVLAHTIPTVSDLFARYAIAEFNSRTWLFNVKLDSTDSPHVILASVFETHNNFDNSNRGGDPDTTTFPTGEESFFLTVPDGRAINGVVKFFDTLLISTDGGKLFKLTGTSAYDYTIDEFYAGSSAVGVESMVNIGNDVMYMRSGGTVEFFSATETSGDVAANDASRWITSSVEGLEGGIAVYNQKDQLVHWFVSAENKVFTFDKDIFFRGQFSPWSIDTTNHPCAFDTEAAVYLNAPDDDTLTVYFGDEDGNLYDFNGSGLSGDGGTVPIRTFRKTRLITELDTFRQLTAGRVLYRRIGECDLQMTLDWSEVYVGTTALVPLKGPIVNAGTFFYNDAINPSYYHVGTPTAWTISTAYTIGDVVSASGGGFFTATTSGTSGGDDSDLAGGSDTGVSWSVYSGQAIAIYSGTGVEENYISSAGFSPAGKGHSFFLTLASNTNVRFFINRLETLDEARRTAQTVIQG